MKDFLDLLSSYDPSDPSEIIALHKILDFVKSNPDPFGHHSLPGHITGSALVLNQERTHVLLNHHKKLNRWVQFGGHSDGDSDVKKTAIREAFEESGLKSLTLDPRLEGIFDLDVHEIAESPTMPLHTHYDIRFLLLADQSEPIVVSPESYAVSWVDLNEVEKYSTEKSFLRMITKVLGYNSQYESQWNSL